MVCTCLKYRTQQRFETGTTQSSLEQRPAQDASISPSPDITRQEQLMLQNMAGKSDQDEAGDQLQLPCLTLTQLLSLMAALGSIGLQHWDNRFNCPERLT